MSFLGVLDLCVAAFSVVLGIVVYQRDTRNEVNQFFGVFCGLAAFCAFLDYLITRAVNVEEVYFLLHIVSVRLLLFTVLVHFFIIYSGNSSLRKWAFLVPCYCITITLIVFGNPEDIFIVKRIPEFGTWGFWAEKITVFNLLMFIWITAQILFVNILGIRMVIRERKKIVRSPAHFVIYGIMISLFLPVFTDIFIPMTGLTVPQFSSITFTIGNVVIGYGVLKYGLFSFRPGVLTREILNNIADSVIITDTGGKIVFMNGAFTRMTGLGEQELLNSDINALFDMPVDDETLGTSAFPSANRLKTKDSERRVIISFSSASGPIPGIKERLFIIHDVSELFNSINELQISQEKYKNIFENILDIYLECLPDGTITEVSPSCLEYTAFTRNDLIGRNISEAFINKEDYFHLMDILSQNGSVQDFELTIRHKEGKQLQFLGNLKTINDPHGMPLKIIGALSEISSLKNSEALLRESENKYRALIESSADPIYMIDEHFTILAANPQLAMVTRKPDGFVTIGKRLYEVLPKNQFDPFSKEIAEVFATGQQKIVTHQVRTASGEVLWDSTSLSPVKNERNGSVIYIIVIMRDITIQMRTDEIIRKNEEKYRFFLENFPGIIYRADMSNQLEFIFGDLENLTGYTQEQLMAPGFNFQKIIHAADLQRVVTSYRDLILNKCDEVSLNFRVVRPDGHITKLRAWFQVSKEISGIPLNIQGVLYDNTTETETNEKIMDAVIETEERERLRFSEDLHDELGPMLSSIRMYVNTIQSKNKPEQERERMQLLEQSIVLIDDAINQARNISRNLVPELLTDYGLVPAIKSFCNQVNSGRTVSIDLQLRDVDEDFRFDHVAELALFRVLKELISNTLKHAQADNIIINFTRRNNMLLIEYYDDGTGFDFQENLKKKGSLGLKNIVNRMGTIGGSLRFSNIPGGGALTILEIFTDHNPVKMEKPDIN